MSLRKRRSISNRIATIATFGYYLPEEVKEECLHGRRHPGKIERRP
jgi:hypothetical protein